MKSFPFVFEATLFYYDYDDGKGHTYKVAGVGSCTSFTDAMKQIENTYGTELVSIERLESIGEEENSIQVIIPIKQEWIPAFIKEDTFNWQKEIINE